ncbi:hypothetical protein AC579_8049 [Pseudocercospora musae]|uniref:Uncharacterized protein n=1 Tax=Pseudocercospora musae TaxID=113226 RepID=A0A139IPB7_9PEZI|nr:hypothetical protein AC579_8049 [Pseudocercospora musae]
MTQHIYAITNAYTPKETVELCGRAGVSKANMRWDKIFISSVLAGMLFSFACAVLLSTKSAPWYQEYAPGLVRTIAALVFPFGLTMVIVTGTDLCTGSFMITTISVLPTTNLHLEIALANFLGKLGRITVPRGHPQWVWWCL